VDRSRLYRALDLLSDVSAEVIAAGDDELARCVVEDVEHQRKAILARIAEVDRDD
jgi:hypothetical protein